jgi:hypothetical protein
VLREGYEGSTKPGSALKGKAISPYKFRRESTVETQKSGSQEEYQRMEPLIPRIFSQYREKTRVKGNLDRYPDIDERMGKGSVEVPKSGGVIHHLEG